MRESGFVSCIGSRQTDAYACAAIDYAVGILDIAPAPGPCGACKHLLSELAIGNPKWQPTIIDSISSSFGRAQTLGQQAGAQVVRELLPAVPSVEAKWTTCAFMLLRTLELHVQYEGCELLKAILKRVDEDTILIPLVDCLRLPTRPSADSTAGAKEIALDSAQQAAAAKLIGEISDVSIAISDRLVQLGAAERLVAAIGNSAHLDSQIQAAQALTRLTGAHPQLGDELGASLGAMLVAIEMDPERAVAAFSPTQLDLLRKFKM